MKNITLLGSQNVYNSDGSLKGIRTVELALPDYDAEVNIYIKTNKKILIYLIIIIFNKVNDVILFEDVKPEVIDKVTTSQLQGFNIELYAFEYEESDFSEVLYMPHGLSVSMLVFLDCNQLLI